MQWSKAKWGSVIFSDEKKWNLDGPDGHSHYWRDLRTEPQRFSKRQLGTSGGFSSRGTLPIAFPSGRMNSEGYQDVLRDNLLPHAGRVAGRNWVYQQDNATIHTSRSAMDWFRTNNVPTMEWPARSPDLNPTENVWGILARRVYKDGKHYDNVPQLQRSIQDQCNAIGPNTLKNLTDSMPNRMFETIKARGGFTGY